MILFRFMSRVLFFILTGTFTLKIPILVKNIIYILFI